jgi:hypothetical protein
MKYMLLMYANETDVPSTPEEDETAAATQQPCAFGMAGG